MTDLTFEEIVQAVQKLSPRQQAALAQSLDLSPVTVEPTREELIAELKSLKASGAFDNVESLRDKYANPLLGDLTDEQLAADIHAAATEWESELDEFFGNNH